MQQASRVYRVSEDLLDPVMESWGLPLRHQLLRSDEAYLFDLGSEIYLWTGRRISSVLRTAGIELAQQAYKSPYNYSSLQLNPITPMLG
ncbi:unnamed protein product [Protopolystoma xenopodis]|uniref:Gelsolin-like domain-containing protein n=1 Tax=Protopolystoma xenopodis TaxID=117903 RepID=A0A3S5B374_9PLAT|nr:unnamed protein product [Protopolystoma xenopodis]